MTKKRISRSSNSFVDYNETPEEFILADLDSMREDWEFAPVSLADVMDNHRIVASEEVVKSIDYDHIISASTSADSHINKLISPADLDSANTDALDQLQPTEDINALDQSAIDPLKLDIITTNKDSAHNNFESIETPIIAPSAITTKKPVTDRLSESLFALKNKALAQDPTLIQTPTDTSTKATIAAYESKVKKLPLISYTALGLSLSALIAILFLSTLIFKTKTNNAKLTDLVSILEEDIRDLTVKYEGLENSSKDVAIAAINQQPVENTMMATKPVTVPTKNRIIRAIVKSHSLKKVGIQRSRYKHLFIALNENKKNKTHKPTPKPKSATATGAINSEPPRNVKK